MKLDQSVSSEPPQFDQESIEATLSRLYPQLHRQALLLTQRPDAADDLVQSLCLRALVRQDAFQPGTCASAWLTRVMRNIFIDDCRAQRVRAASPSDRDVPAESTERTFSPHDVLVTDDVLRAIPRLPPSQQKLLRLIHFSDLSQRDVAAQLGLSTAALATRLHRARRRLRHVLEQTFHEKLRAGAAFECNSAHSRREREERLP